MFNIHILYTHILFKLFFITSISYNFTILRITAYSEVEVSVEHDWKFSPWNNR